MKALASDFDGTLYFLNEKSGFKQIDIEAIEAFQLEGNLFGLCTGRPLIGVLRELKGNVNCDFFIVSTGACILDKNLNIIYEKCISKKLIQEIHEKYKDKDNVFIQASLNAYTFDSNPKTLERKQLIKHFDEIDDNHIYSLSFDASSEAEGVEICKDINKKYEGQLTAFLNDRYIDVVADGCSKGKGIEKLKEILNIQYIGGIGDSYNDIPMLKTVDKSFTFHRSPVIVKEKADCIVDTISEALLHL